MGIITGLIDLILMLFELAVIVHFIVSLVKPSSNKWIELLNSIVEPVLKPVRKLLVEKLPAKYQNFDWSHLVLVVVIAVIRIIL